MWISATQINWMRDKRRKRVFESAGTIGNLAYLALSMDLIFAFFPSQGEPSMSSPLRICAALCAEACMNSPKSLLPTVSNSWSLMFKYDNIYTLTYIYNMSKAFHEFDGTSSARCPFHYQFQYVPLCSSMFQYRYLSYYEVPADWEVFHWRQEMDTSRSRKLSLELRAAVPRCLDEPTPLKDHLR